MTVSVFVSQLGYLLTIRSGLQRLRSSPSLVSSLQSGGQCQPREQPAVWLRAARLPTSFPGTLGSRVPTPSQRRRERPGKQSD